MLVLRLFSQSTMAMSSLMPSASTESEWKGGTTGQCTIEAFQSQILVKHREREGSSPDMQEKASGAGGSSCLGRIGSQIFQKTVGLVLRSRSDQQAKLGEKNKFYYDENLKRWLEEGAEPPGDEPALPPPPRSTSLQNRTTDYTGPKIDNLHSNSSEWNSGIPPIPPSSNHFSAHGRMGVCARYVVTFNKDGGTPANLFQSPSLLAAKSGAGPVGPNAKFFIPTPVALGDKTVQTTGENLQEAVFTNESPASSVENISFPSPLTSESTSTSSMPTMQRIPSMDTIVSKRSGAIANSRSSLPPHSRRTASWSGSFSDTFNPPKMTELKPLAEVLGMPPSLFMPGDELHEVEL
ncbi:unnamed protein product [Camellia sinensis]